LRCDAFPQFNMRMPPVAYAVEQDFLGRPSNSDAFLNEICGKHPQRTCKGGRERSYDVYNSQIIAEE
jgi:hypothetical protein